MHSAKTKPSNKGPTAPPELAQVMSSSHQALTIQQYQKLSSMTDRTASRRGARLDFPLLGLFGEVGSLLSELKKKQRDTVSYYGYEDSVVEELGDALWYFSNLATRAGLKLSDMARDIHRDSVSDRRSNRRSRDIKFAQLQPSLKGLGPGAQRRFEITLMRLAGESGNLIGDFSAGS